MQKDTMGEKKIGASKMRNDNGDIKMFINRILFSIAS